MLKQPEEQRKKRKKREKTRVKKRKSGKTIRNELEIVRDSLSWGKRFLIYIYSFFIVKTEEGLVNAINIRYF